MAVLDDANLVYDLEMSRQVILDQLGFKHTFSVECPYGTENDRAVQAALLRYQLARNYMPDADVDDLDRSNDMDPTTSREKYVRWRRGPLTKTWTSSLAKSQHVKGSRAPQFEVLLGSYGNLREQHGV